MLTIFQTGHSFRHKTPKTNRDAFKSLVGSNNSHRVLLCWLQLHLNPIRVHHVVWGKLQEWQGDKKNPKTAAPINLKPSFWVVHQIIQKKNTNVHHHFAPWPHTHQGFLPMLGSRVRDQGFSFMIPCDCSLFSRCIHGAKKKAKFCAKWWGYEMVAHRTIRKTQYNFSIVAEAFFNKS